MQVMVFQQNKQGDWIPIVAYPSLDERSTVENAILYVADAVSVETREPVKIKALGTGRK